MNTKRKTIVEKKCVRYLYSIKQLPHHGGGGDGTSGDIGSNRFSTINT